MFFYRLLYGNSETGNIRRLPIFKNIYLNTKNVKRVFIIEFFKGLEILYKFLIKNML